MDVSNDICLRIDDDLLYKSIFEKRCLGMVVHHGWLLVADIFELPGVFLAIVDESRCVVALVQVLQHSG